MYIELKWVDLVAGYKRIRRSTYDLQSEWSGKLSAAYRSKSRAYQEKVRTKQKRDAQFKRIALWIVVASVGFLLLGGILFFAYESIDGLCLIALGVLGLLSPLPLWLLTWGRKLSAPLHPLREPLKSDLFPSNLTSVWWNRLAARIPSEYEIEAIANRTNNYGLNGEYDFIRQIAPVLPANSFILRGLCQVGGDDLDVVIVGSQGIWLFEVKYWSGKIVWRNGKWDRIQFDYELRQDVRRTEDQGPDRQWLRYREDILKTLRIRGNGLLNRRPALKDIHGGIVFSLPGAEYDIPPNPPFRYGNIGGWTKVLTEAPVVRSLHIETLLEVLDILLARHHDIKKDQPKVSALNLANSLTNEAANKIKHWIQDDPVV